MAGWTLTDLITMNAITLNALAGFQQQLEDHYAAIPAGFELWAPSSWAGMPSERLTAIEQVCHVRDFESEGYHVRFQRNLAGIESHAARFVCKRRAKDHLAGRQAGIADTTHR